jgi:ribonuclease-3 family protein
VNREVTTTHSERLPDNHSETGLNVHFAIAQPPPPLTPTQLQQLSPAVLAYLGDAVYELYIRQLYLSPPKRLESHHHLVVAQVCAEQQAEHLRSLLPHLTPGELVILKRGRNAASGKPRRLDSDIYRQASSLETLIGYLYLTDPQRLMHLLTQLDLHL